MPLESATYIHQLEPAYPASTDQLAQADEHLRLIKATLQATFPNINGPVTTTEEQLNAPFVMPIGSVIAWYGSSSAVPVGWALCNGQTVARSDGSGDITTPDLRNRFIAGAGTLALGQAGGNETFTATSGSAGAHAHTIAGGEHSHTGEAQDHALTAEQLPRHTHPMFADVAADTALSGEVTVARATTSSPGESEYQMRSASGSVATVGVTGNRGAGQAHRHGLTINSATHTHTVSAEGAHTHSVTVGTIPPCIALHFLMKV